MGGREGQGRLGRHRARATGMSWGWGRPGRSTGTGRLSTLGVRVRQPQKGHWRRTSECEMENGKR
eukprot:scaffold285747_cov44-Tisochrysis_lutea.AAC.1